MSLPRRALILDCETDGLDPRTCRIIEIAVTLYDLKLATPIASFAALARGDSNAAEHINGIPVASLAEAFEQERLWVAVCDLMASADVICAHNASFDRSFVEASQGFNSVWRCADGTGRRTIPWVCALNHVQWPGKRTRNDLTSLALSLGVPVIAAHRAATDVDILCRILTRVSELGTDLQTLIGDALAPRQRVMALVSFDQKDKAKAAGFTWEADKKRWVREVKVGDTFEFKTRVIP
jgi:DNA polymerase III subunit epsilon